LLHTQSEKGAGTTIFKFEGSKKNKTFGFLVQICLGRNFIGRCDLMNLGLGKSFSWTTDASRGTLSPEMISKNFEESDVTLSKVLVLKTGKI
jgi:hypothetical protein